MPAVPRFRVHRWARRLGRHPLRAVQWDGLGASMTDQAAFNYNEARVWDARSEGDKRLVERGLELHCVRDFIDTMTCKVGGAYIWGAWGTELIESIHDELNGPPREVEPDWSATVNVVVTRVGSGCGFETPRLMAEQLLRHFERERVIRRFPIEKLADVAPVYRWSDADKHMGGRHRGPVHSGVGTYVAHWWVAYGYVEPPKAKGKAKRQRVWPDGDWG